MYECSTVVALVQPAGLQQGMQLFRWAKCSPRRAPMQCGDIQFFRFVSFSSVWSFPAAPQPRWSPTSLLPSSAAAPQLRTHGSGRPPLPTPTRRTATTQQHRRWRHGHLNLVPAPLHGSRSIATLQTTRCCNPLFFFLKFAC